MKKYMLVIVVAAIFLLTACNGTTDLDTGAYTPPDTNYEYDINGPEQPALPYEENGQPEEPQPDEENEQPGDAAEPPAQSSNANSQHAVAISAASQHAIAIMEDGSLWAWGGDTWYGLIGDGTTEVRNLPVQIMDDVAFAVAGHHHSFAITNSGELWAWGGNRYGQIGDGSTQNRSSPVKIMDDVVYVTMPSTVPNSHVGDGARSYAIRSDGGLWAWGHSGSYDVPWDVALGDGRSENRYSPIQILEDVTSVVPTHIGGYALTANGTLWGWHGTIIISNFENNEWVTTEIEAQRYPTPVMENVASISSNARFAITTSGELWSLGLGLEPAWVMNNVVYATGSGASNFAITTNGELWAWGQNRLPSHWRPSPVLGDGTTVDRDAPVRIMGDVVSVTTMGNITYAITTDGNLWGWGTNTVSALDQETEGYAWEYALDGEIPSGKRWLLDDDGGIGIRLSPVKMLENVISVAPTYFMFDHGWVRGFRTFALTACGSVWAWGENDVFGLGQGSSLLGDGASENRPYPVRII